MLVTHVITRLIVGGAQENTISTVLGLRSRPEFQVNLIAGPTYGPEGSLESEFAHCAECLQVVPSLIRPIRPLKDLQALFDLRQIFRRTRPAIVHTHSGKAGIIGRWAARMEKVPLIIHGVHGPSFGPWQGAVANFALRAAERSAGKTTHHFVAVAQAMIEQYLATGIGRPEQYTRIFSGFQLEPFLNAVNAPELRASLGLNPNHLVIGKIARMVALKGHDDLFEIAPRLVEAIPNVRFLLVGGGPWEDRFKEMARAKGLEQNFVFTGLVPPSQIPKLTAIMDLLVHLSLREGLPRALPQALAAGKPVVAYDCDGAGEVCLTNHTGILVPAQDRRQLLQALQTLCSDASLRHRLGEKGRAFVRERFPVEKMVEETYELYRRLLRQRGVMNPESPT